MATLSSKKAIGFLMLLLSSTVVVTMPTGDECHTKCIHMIDCCKCTDPCMKQEKVCFENCGWNWKCHVECQNAENKCIEENKCLANVPKISVGAGIAPTLKAPGIIPTCVENCQKQEKVCFENCGWDRDCRDGCWDAVSKCIEETECLPKTLMLTQEEVYPEAIDLEMKRVHLLGEEISVEENAFEANLVTVQEAKTEIKMFTKKLFSAEKSLRQMMRADDLGLSAADSSQVNTDKKNELAAAISQVEHSIEAFGQAIYDSVAQVSDAKDETQYDIEEYAKVAEVLFDLGISEEKVEKVLSNLDD